MDDIIIGIGDEVLLSFLIAAVVLAVLIKFSPELVIEPCRHAAAYVVDNWVMNRRRLDADLVEEVTPDTPERHPRDQRDPCPICLAEPPRLALETNCGHIFCGSCLRTYWEMGNFLSGMVCPLCRQQVTMLFLSFNDLERTSGVLLNERREITAMTGLYNRQNSGLPRSGVTLGLVLRAVVAENYLRPAEE